MESKRGRSLGKTVLAYHKGRRRWEGATAATDLFCKRLALHSWRLLPLVACIILLTTTLLQSDLKHLDEPPLPSSPPLGSLLLPPPLPVSPTPPKTLVDLRTFRYLVNTNVCGPPGRPPTGVILVHSDTRRPAVRNAIRSSLPAAELRQMGLRRVFMLADASRSGKGGEERDTVPQAVIEKESQEHQDLVQGNFIDSYHNMTYKHVMALDWAVTFCPKARWLIKTDDDTLFDVFSLMDVLKTLPPRGFLGGNLFQRPQVYRKPDNKWFVPYSVWPHAHYPSYLTGALYMMTPDVAKRLLKQSTVEPFFWIDDVYVTGMLAERARCQRTGLNRLYVTTSRCISDAVSQRFSLTQPSDELVFSPGFEVLFVTDKNLTVLERFNELIRYCFRFPCGDRKLHPDCKNEYPLRENITEDRSWMGEM